MKVLFGELNNKAVIKSYTGINTETANTTVDNQNNTIKVDVNTDNIATVDYVNEHIDMFTGEITLSGDEELVLQIQNGRLYHEGELYTGDITFSDEYIVGDVNGDRVINQTDIDTLDEWLAEYDHDTDAPAFDIDEDAADANKDGIVDGKDVTRIRKYINGNPISPTGETFTRPIITLNVNNGITYFEDELYTDTITLAGDATLYIVYEKGLVKNITTTNPNLDGTVHYDSEQELTNEEKEVARSNIGLDIDSIARRSILLLSFGDVTYEGKTVKSIISDFRVSNNRPRKNSQFYYINEEVPVYTYDFEVVGIAVPGIFSYTVHYMDTSKRSHIFQS